MKRTTELDDSTLGAMRDALQELANIGVPEHAKLRVRTRASFNPSGALVREITVEVPRPVD